PCERDTRRASGGGPAAPQPASGEDSVAPDPARPVHCGGQPERAPAGQGAPPPLLQDRPAAPGQGDPRSANAPPTRLGEQPEPGPGPLRGARGPGRQSAGEKRPSRRLPRILPGHAYHRAPVLPARVALALT